MSTAAYFQGRGISALVQSAVAPGSGPTFVTLPPAIAKTITYPDVSAIHNRNPFDSETGPLNAVEIPELETEAKEFVVVDPLNVPVCPDVKIHILTESEDPLWSFAALTGPGEAKPKIRRVGDDVAGQKVAYIGYNPANGSPTVWLEGTTLCQANLFGEEQTTVAKKEPKVAAKTTKKSKKSKNKIDPEIAAKIKKVSDTEFEIDRSAIDKILENQSALMRSARIVPEQKDGKVVGIRLFGVRPDSLLGTLGLKNGDRLETINGFNMGSPEKALEAYARLRTANNLELTLNRRGKPTTINLRIK